MSSDNDDFVITELAEANPVPRTAKPTAQDRAEADRVLERVLAAAPRSRRRWPILVPVAGVLVVIVVVAVALSLKHSGAGNSGTPRKSGLQIVLQAEPTPPQQPQVTPAAMSREMEIVRERLRSVVHSFNVTERGDELVVTAGNVAPVKRPRIVRLSSAPGRLSFYDWEANALTPNGKTVASQFQDQDPTALAMSQGSDTGPPGQPNAGGLTLYEAVKLAAKQPKAVNPHNARSGPEYYMFGAPGSAACAAKARTEGILPTAGEHCLLAGPDNEFYATPRQAATQHLAFQLPRGVSASDGRVLAVQQGTVVLQAATAGQQIDFSSPSARFYVLHDDVALRGAEITNPQLSSDTSGSPDVTFGFNSRGSRAFQNVTRQIAHRGQDVSTLGQTLDQHFAVALDNQLLTVPSIDFKIYPDGIIDANSADITGGFSRQSAKDLATEIRYGPLPLQLRVIRS